jgi:hypothetical protein
MKKPVILSLIIILCLVFAISAKKTSYIINPTITDFESYPKLSSSLRLFIGTIEDSSSSNDTGAIGFTRTGIKTKAPIICSPSISDAVKKSIESIFTKQQRISTDQSAANFVLKIKVLEFSIIETSSGLTQTMTATIKLETTLTDPYAADKIKKFVVESQNAKTTHDTSNSAESITKGALESALQEMIKTINNLDL